jgi:hypothetical protein
MTLNKLIQLRQGVVSMKVFKDTGSGKLLFALDKDLGSRRVMGPLFAESELYELLDIMLDYDKWESGAFHGKPNRRVLHQAVDLAEQEDVRNEIHTAIQKAATSRLACAVDQTAGNMTHSGTRIQVLPTLPEYSYVHTCPKCGCHVASLSILPPGGSIMSLCGWCNHVYHVEGW